MEFISTLILSVVLILTACLTANALWYIGIPFVAYSVMKGI